MDYLVQCHTACTIACIYASIIQQGAPYMCAQVVVCCEPVSDVQCREDSMPLMNVLLVAIW